MMKFFLVLGFFGGLGYAGFQLSKLNKAFHKKLVAFIRRYRIILLLMLLSAFGALVYVSVYSSAVDSKCKNLNISIQTIPKDTTPDEFFRMGDREFDKGNCMQAIVDYSQAIVRDLSLAQAYNNRAYTYMRMRYYDFALRDVNRAIELRPDYINALMNRADLYNFYYQVDKQKAIADYDRIIALGRMDPAGSVCGHRAVAIYGSPGHTGWNMFPFLQLMFHARNYGCTMQPR